MTSPLEVYYQPGTFESSSLTVIKRGQWSDEEGRILQNLFLADTAPVVIASSMGRSINSILSKLLRFGLIRWSIGHKAYFRTPKP